MKSEVSYHKLRVADIINPPANSHFSQHIVNLQESIYASSKQAPLGKGPKPNIPFYVNNFNWTYGRVTEKGDSVGEVVFPFTSSGTAGLLGESPDNRVGCFYRLYDTEVLKTAGTKTEYDKSGKAVKELMSWCGDHKSLNLTSVKLDDFKEKNQPCVGKAICLLYDAKLHKPAGIKIEYDNTGRAVKELMNWCQGHKSLNLATVEADNFKENHQPCVGEALCPEKIAKKLPSDFNFGVKLDPQCYVMDQAITFDYCNPIKIPKKGFRQEQGVLHQLRNKLKMKNYHHFDDLISAFKEYDQSGSGKISLENFQQMCQKFGIIVSSDMVRNILSSCDVLDNDGFISYQEFIHFLNWKDKLPEKLDFRVRAEKYHNEWIEGIKKTPDDVVDRFKSVTSFIGSPHKEILDLSRGAGIPSCRTDLQAPIFRKSVDLKNYGQISSISEIIHPNVFTEHGISEEDLFALRSKEELQFMFEKSDMQMDEELFQVLWQKVSKDNRASIEAFRKVLNEYIWANHEYNTKG